MADDSSAGQRGWRRLFSQLLRSSPMAHVSIPQQPRPGSRIPKGVLGVVGGLLILIALFALYLVSPFFTVGEYERTVVTRFGQFSSVAGPGLHFRIPFVNGLEAFPIGIQRMQKDHVTLNYRIAEGDVRRIYTTNRDYRANLESFMIDRFKRGKCARSISRRWRRIAGMCRSVY